MHERERHRLIQSAALDRGVVTVGELVRLTGASEATVRRDLAALDASGAVRRVRGGVESLATGSMPALAGRTYDANAMIRRHEKVAIARAAAELCRDGEPIIINGGTTTFEMVHLLSAMRLKILTNSLPIANHLLTNSANHLLMPGGTLYREQNIVLSAFQDDATRHFWARRMFMGCQGIAPVGVMEVDPLLIRSEEKLMSRADELIVLADSSKFERRSSLVLCPLERIHTVITDDAVPDRAASMIEAAGVRLIVATTEAARKAAG